MWGKPRRASDAQRISALAPAVLSVVVVVLAIATHVSTMIQGTYRGGAANLFVDPEYGRLLVTDPQGAFWTAFGNLSPAKIESIVLRGAG